MIGRRQPLDPLAQRREPKPVSVRVASAGEGEHPVVGPGRPRVEPTADGFVAVIPLHADHESPSGLVTSG